MGGLVSIIRRKNKKLDQQCFSKLTMSRKLISSATTLDEYKKFVMALGDSNVQRIDALIRAGLRKKAGIHGMFQLLDRAMRGVYKPKGFTEEEKLRTVLFLRLGGSRVAGLTH
jgi:hypothetical protein